MQNKATRELPACSMWGAAAAAGVCMCDEKGVTAGERKRRVLLIGEKGAEIIMQKFQSKKKKKGLRGKRDATS